jgi:RND family efflux transporter MFP subunit
MDRYPKNPTRRATRGALLLLFAFAFATPACSGRDAGEMTDAHEAEEAEHAEDTGVVTLTEAAWSNAGIEVAEVLVLEVPASGAAGIVVPGQVAFDPERVALVSPRTSGRIESLHAVEGDQVAAGQVVARILSPAFLTAQNDYRQAAHRAELLAGTPDEAEGRALADAARRRLSLLGAVDSVIDRLARGEAPLDLLPIEAPFAGSIVEAHALTGAAVEPGSSLFTLADLSVVNVAAEVPERSLSLVRLGATAEVHLAAYPDRRVHGTVARISQELDPQTRTVRAILRLANPQRLLRPGMYATVHLGADADGERVSRPVLPEAAVVTDGADRWVFVETGERTFERRAVEVEPLGGGQVMVRSGVTGGERVAVRGAFTLKAELAKGEFGEHHD